MEDLKDREFAEKVVASMEGNFKLKEADRFKNIMASLGQDSAEISKEERKLGLMAQKIIRGLAHDKKPKQVPPELIDYTVATAKREAINTMQYLQFERQISSFYFRKNIHLTDLELEQMITDNQVAIMNQAREFNILKAWLMFSGYLEDFVAYRNVVDAAIRADIEKDKPKVVVAPETPAEVAIPEGDEIALRKAKAKEAFK